MRPKTYFLIGAILVGAGFAVSILISVFFIGVTVFRLRVNSPFSYLRSEHGFQVVLENFPFIPLLIALLGVLVGIFIMRRYDFSYKHAFYGIAGGFLVALGLIGVVIDATGLPERAEQVTELHPFLHVKYSNDAWVAGTIYAIEQDRIFIQTPGVASFTIFITEDTSIIPPTLLRQGEWVRVSGQRSDDTFTAEIIMHTPSPRKQPHMRHAPVNNPFSTLP